LKQDGEISVRRLAEQKGGGHAHRLFHPTDPADQKPNRKLA
jgi:hypothetical protein